MVLSNALLVVWRFGGVLYKGPTRARGSGPPSRIAFCPSFLETDVPAACQTFLEALSAPLFARNLHDLFLLQLPRGRTCTRRCLLRIQPLCLDRINDVLRPLDLPQRIVQLQLVQIELLGRALHILLRLNPRVIDGLVAKHSFFYPALGRVGALRLAPELFSHDIESLAKLYRLAFLVHKQTGEFTSGAPHE